MGSQPKPLRLAILEADTPQPNTKEQYGGYGGVFTALLRSACLASTPPQTLDSVLDITIHDIVNDLNSYPSLDDIDAILITGSKHSAFHDDDFIVKLVEYTKSAIDSGKVRVVGVCFGHQIVGRALGVKVEKNPIGWELAVTDVELTPKGKEIFGMDKMRIHQMHRDVVSAYPPGSEPLARTDVCPVQGMYSPRKYITVQGHPEFTEQIVTEILNVRHKTGIFDDELYTEAMARVGVEQDGVLVGRAFLKFLKE